MDWTQILKDIFVSLIVMPIQSVLRIIFFRIKIVKPTGEDKNYYEEFEILHMASIEVIQGAHDSLIKKYLSDIFSVNSKKEKILKKITRVHKAYETLIDPEKRKQYDKMLNKQENDKGKENLNVSSGYNGCEEQIKSIEKGRYIYQLLFLFTLTLLLNSIPPNIKWVPDSLIGVIHISLVILVFLTLMKTCLYFDNVIAIIISCLSAFIYIVGSIGYIAVAIYMIIKNILNS